MQEKHLRLLEELDIFFKDFDQEDIEFDNLLKKVDSISKSLNKGLKSIEGLEKDVAILKAKKRAVGSKNGCK